MNLILLIIMGILYIGHHWVALGIVFMIFLFRGKNRTKRKVTSKSKANRGVHKVFTIAKQKGVSVPNFHSCQKLLIEIYDLYVSSKEQFPSLSEHYDSIMDSLWPALQRTSGKEEWTDILLKVRKSWPKPQKADIWDKIDEAKQAASRLQESIDEVNGKKWGTI